MDLTYESVKVEVQEMTPMAAIRILCARYGYRILWKGMLNKGEKVVDIWLERGTDYSHDVVISHKHKLANLPLQFQNNYQFDMAKHGKVFPADGNLSKLMTEFGYDYKYKHGGISDEKYQCINVGGKLHPGQDQIIYTHNYGIALPLRIQFEVVAMLEKLRKPYIEILDERRRKRYMRERVA